MFAVTLITAKESFSDFMTRMIPMPEWDWSKFADLEEPKAVRKREAERVKNDAHKTFEDYLDGSLNGLVRAGKYFIKLIQITTQEKEYYLR